MKKLLAKIFPRKKTQQLIEIPDGVPHAAWADPRVQAIYQILSDTDIRVPEDEHWEGHIARLCVDAMSTRLLNGQYIVPDFQSRVLHWLNQVISIELIDDVRERARRFAEESAELVQSVGMTKEELLFEIENVYSKPPGETHQEIGGVLTTLNAFGSALRIDVNGAGEEELARVWTEIPRIREKNAAKKRMQDGVPVKPAISSRDQLLIDMKEQLVEVANNLGHIFNETQQPNTQPIVEALLVRLQEELK